MSRICARPGCSRHAVATLSYSYREGIAYLDDLAPVAHPMVHDLCVEHAEHLRVPIGWECRDARTVSSISSASTNAPTGTHRRTA